MISWSTRAAAIGTPLPDWARRFSVRSRCALVLGLAAALAIGGCSENSDPEPSDTAPVAEPFDAVSVPAGTSIGDALPLRPGSALSRPEVSPATEVQGQWLGGEALASGRVVAFIDADDGPLALVRKRNNSFRVRP